MEAPTNPRLARLATIPIGGSARKPVTVSAIPTPIPASSLSYMSIVCHLDSATKPSWAERAGVRQENLWDGFPVLTYNTLRGYLNLLEEY